MCREEWATMKYLSSVEVEDMPIIYIRDAAHILMA